MARRRLWALERKVKGGRWQTILGRTNRECLTEEMELYRYHWPQYDWRVRRYMPEQIEE